MARTRLGKRIVRGSVFAGLASRAARYARSPEKLHDLVRQARAKAGAAGARGAMKEVWESLMTLLRLVRAYARGDYRQLPWTTLVLVVAAVLYFLLPVDVIPDFFIGMGYIDDAAVIAWVANTIGAELEQFRRWEAADVQYAGPSNAGVLH